jgi:lipoyl(octanoyl) transferase
VTPGIWIDLGLRDYQEAWDLQKRLVARRQADEIPDVLLLCEHPEVITLGRKATSRGNVIADDVPVVEVERGGDVTYHGPGQLVGYPIVKLAEPERDLHRYLRNLEEGLIAVCGEVGLLGTRKDKLTGVWLGERKVASIGIAVRRWVTLHGFALNVSTDLARFATINPCGLDAEVMTSLSEAAGRAITVEALKPRVAAEVGAALGRALAPADLQRVG